MKPEIADNTPGLTPTEVIQLRQLVGATLLDNYTGLEAMQAAEEYQTTAKDCGLSDPAFNRFNAMRVKYETLAELLFKKEAAEAKSNN